MHPQSTLKHREDIHQLSRFAERFWSRVDRSAGPDACWRWQGRLDRKGYGNISLTLNGIACQTKAHRAAFLLTYGAIDQTLLVCHRCDVRACCNPAHLWQGTHLDNVHDRDAKGRTATGERSAGYLHRLHIRRRRGAAHRWAKLTADQVYAIRNLYAQGERIADIARAFAVTGANVGYIVRGKTWVPAPVVVPAIRQEAAATSKTTPEQRFWDLLDRSGGPDACWLWTHRHNADGYGERRFRGRQWRTHRLAWTLTHGAIPDGLNVLHRCHARACCNPAHLELGTQKDNCAHMLASGRHASQIYTGIWPRGAASVWSRHPEFIRRGDDHYTRRHPEKVRRGSASTNAKLTEEDVETVRRLVSEGVMQSELAVTYGVTKTTICSIVAGRTWTHVGGIRGGPGTAKLKAEQVQVIRATPHKGHGHIAALARAYGVGEKAISDILTRHTWHHLKD